MLIGISNSLTFFSIDFGVMRRGAIELTLLETPEVDRADGREDEAVLVEATAPGMEGITA
ncbi:hypothetical protein PSA5_22330 [Pseudomonas syringae pv. actinidiae]|nr:hypothetical protein PSA5_22330 [Pseudomonas syringae pv. actinidiae]